VPRLFALDHNFPDPIVAVLADFQEDAELVRVDQIDSRMPDLEDWELLLALSLHAQHWDGLITTDSSMLNQGPELAVLIQTKLTLVGSRPWAAVNSRRRRFVSIVTLYLTLHYLLRAGERVSVT
jgi:hypothetical protein